MTNAENKMKKIVILVDQLNSHGGIEKLVVLKANYWATVFNYDITIISTEQYQKPIIYSLSNKVKFIDLALNYNRNKSYLSISNVYKFIKNIVRIQKYLFAQKPDFILVASHIPITYFAPFLIGKAKTIKEFHFSKYNESKQGVKNKVLAYIESKYDFLVVLSKEEQQYYYSKNTVVLPNPIENNNYKTKADILNNKNIAVAAGRFAPVKRLESLIEIWDQFCKKNKSWKLYIFGTTGNDYFKEIERIVKNRNLQDFVIFKGQSDEIQNEIANSKVLLMTSEHECFPMVILEAQSVGVPVISYDCPTGPRNIIHHKKDGILIENNNINSFVTQLLQFDEDKKEQKMLSENAYENAKNYSIEKVMQQWNNLIFDK